MISALDDGGFIGNVKLNPFRCNALSSRVDPDSVEYFVLCNALFDLAFPDYQNAESHFFKLIDITFVPFHIGEDLDFPEFPISFGDRSLRAISMMVPKTAMNENDH